jgi:hypothetical protein
MKKKAKSEVGKKKLKIKDLTVGRKAGSVKGGQATATNATTTPTTTPRATVKPGNSWIVPCV